MKWILAAGLLALSTRADAEVVSANPNGLHVREIVQLVVPTASAWEAFARIADWWNKDHTYSGDSANLALTLSPGGCFCERIPTGGGIEHLRVTYVEPGKRVVLTGSLGPLLYQATAGVMDVQIERIAGGSKVTLDYRAAGFAEGGADKLAPIVDGVLADQMRRYRTYARAKPPELKP
jgi:uncharacterized protein YndB with AHSA1/START domain